MDMPESYQSNMLKPSEAIKTLKEQGSRMTAQRLAVLDILYNNRMHPSAEYIITRVKKKLGQVSVATVYNTLDTLEKNGFIKKIDGLETKSHYDSDTGNHSHCICKKCKIIFNVILNDDIKKDSLPDNFLLTDVILQGLCEKCRQDDNINL